jgi:hypothetical protein
VAERLISTNMASSVTPAPAPGRQPPARCRPSLVRPGLEKFVRKALTAAAFQPSSLPGPVQAMGGSALPVFLYELRPPRTPILPTTSLNPTRAVAVFPYEQPLTTFLRTPHSLLRIRLSPGRPVPCAHQEIACSLHIATHKIPCISTSTCLP